MNAARQVRAIGRLVWCSHAAVLCLVVGYVGLSALQGSQDANIGLGLGLLALGVLGMPWTLPVFLHDGFTTDSPLFIAGAAVGALINLLLDFVVWAWAVRRRATTAPLEERAGHPTS